MKINEDDNDSDEGIIFCVNEVIKEKCGAKEIIEIIPGYWSTTILCKV